MNKIFNFKDWAIARHEETNHKYADYLPYRFHLDMVAQVASQFKEVWEKWYIGIPFRVAYLAAYGHDLIEDARVTPKDIMKTGVDERVVKIIYAITNEKGWTRSERANDAYYEGIRNTDGAIFVKLCDRIANVKFGIMVGGEMVEKYKQENNNFLSKLGVSGSHYDKYHPCNIYAPMVQYLNKLFELKGTI